MTSYKLTPEGNASLKKAWVTAILIGYVAIIITFSYNLLYRSGQIKDIVIFSIIAVALAVGYYFGRKKYFNGVDSMHLTLDEERVTVKLLNEPDITIAFSAISKITQRKNGIFLVNKLSKKNSIHVIDKFEHFDEIKKIIIEKVGEDKLQPVS